MKRVGLVSTPSTVLMLLCLFFALPITSFSATVCGNQGCLPETKHVATWVSISDGMGHAEWREQIDEAALATAATDGCKAFGDAHSNAYQTFTISNCSPVLPLPDTNVGGTAVSISVQGDYRQVRKSDGALLAAGTSSWGLLQIGCADALNPNSPATGTNGQCYCKPPMQWDSSRRACISVRDIWHYANLCRPEFGGPIVPLVGAKVLRQDLGVFVGREMLAAVYDTTSNIPYVGASSVINGATGVAAVRPAALGASWTTSAHKALYIQRLGVNNVGFTIHAFRGNGQFISFSHPTSNSYVPAHAGIREQLIPVLDAAGYQTSQVRLIDAEGNVELYDMYSLTTGSKANLLSVSYATGGSLHYTYGDGGALIKVTDHQSRSIKFRNEPIGTNFQTRTRELEAPDGSVISFAYNAANQLSQITWPDGKTRKYLYERIELPWAVTGIVDENDSRLSTYTYDAHGRAIATEYAGGVNRYAVTYGVPPSLSVTESFVGNSLTRDHWWVPPQNLSLELPNGVNSMLSAVDVGGMPFLNGQTQPAGSGCAASANAKTIDSNGNVLSIDDFQGQRTCYAYDSSNRETVRVEGLENTTACSGLLGVGATLPAGARKITTSWHPDWAVRTQVSQPLRRNSTVYHGHPDPFNSNATANCTSAAVRADGKPLPVVCKQVEQATLDTGAANSPVSDDPYLDKVQLLLHGNGTNGSNIFADSSSNGYSPSLVGAPVISTTQSKFGGAAMSFGGSADALSYPHSANLNLASGDFTVEAWIYLNSLSTTRTILQKDQSYGTTFPSYVMSVTSAGALNCLVGTGNGAAYSQWVTSANGLITTDNWYHVAFTRQGTTLRTFINGSLVQTASQTGTPVDGGKPLVIGRYPGGGGAADGWMAGYIDDLRISKGMARYIANFTPPPQEAADSSSASATSITRYTYDAAGRVLSSVDPNNRTTTYAYFTDSAFGGTYDPYLDKVQLLLHGNGTNGSNIFADSSSNGYSPSLVGAPVISTTQSRFGGAAISFGGAADALSYPHSANLNLASGDFTVEAWIYLNSLSTTRTILQKDQSYGTTFPSYVVSVTSAGALNCLVGTGNGATYAQWVTSANGLITTGNWYHVAFTREGTTLRTFINGSLAQTATQTGTPVDGGKPLVIGRYPSGGGAADTWMAGNIDDLRISKGMARYTANFTPPAQEFPHTGPTAASTGHTVGDLQSVTNAAGHVTQFNLYDPAGRVRQMTDPKGVVTDTTYTPRGWVNTVTTTPPGGSARTTTYTYDNVGQVTGVALPDGTSLSYSYDAAHRLVGLTDARGNAVSYTLDNVGNRIGEEVRDPTGNLQRSISRSFDALNRLQQVSGAAR